MIGIGIGTMPAIGKLLWDLSEQKKARQQWLRHNLQFHVMQREILAMRQAKMFHVKR